MSLCLATVKANVIVMFLILLTMHNNRIRNFIRFVLE